MSEYDCKNVQIFTFKMALTTEQNGFVVEAYFWLNCIIPDFLHKLWLDETHFLLSGHVNSKYSVF